MGTLADREKKQESLSGVLLPCFSAIILMMSFFRLRVCTLKITIPEDSCLPAPFFSNHQAR